MDIRASLVRSCIFEMVGQGREVGCLGKWLEAFAERQQPLRRENLAHGAQKLPRIREQARLQTFIVRLFQTTAEMFADRE